MVECADCKLVSLGFNSLNVLFDLEFLFYLGYYFKYIFDSNISLSRFTTDCCVIGNVSTLGVGIWGFKSLQSDRFFTYFYSFWQINAISTIVDGISYLAHLRHARPCGRAFSFLLSYFINRHAGFSVEESIY